jgi:trimethylamine--corrinoid protein Co-methyltransferase
MVIDDEMVNMLRRVERGFEIDPEHLMLDLIADVGHGGHYLGQRRTLEYLKKGEHFQPKLSFRSAYQVWQDSGYDEVAAARERANQLLKEHEVLPLASEEEKALEELIARVDPEVRCDLRASCLSR